MLVDFVRVNAMTTVKESLGAMLASGQRCALVVDENDLLEGIMSSSDLQHEVLRVVEESIYSNVPIIIEVNSFFLLQSILFSYLCLDKFNLNVKLA